LEAAQAYTTMLSTVPWICSHRLTLSWSTVSRPSCRPWPPTSPQTPRRSLCPAKPWHRMNSVCMRPCSRYRSLMLRKALRRGVLPEVVIILRLFHQAVKALGKVPCRRVSRRIMYSDMLCFSPGQSGYCKSVRCRINA
tara:strand:+ start:120667 stop:121080 length:414 start_codon:yes stop_codon:yes gene_type:complete